MMQKLIAYPEQLPQSIKTISDVGVWGIVMSGWLSLIQPWLTAVATLLAIGWTGIQIYSWFRKRKNGK